MNFNYRSDIGALILLGSAIILFLYPLFFPVPQFIVTPDFGRSDSWHLSIATKYTLWQKLHTQQLPLWTDKNGLGFPLLGEGQIGTFFIPNLLSYTFFDFATAYNFTLVLVFLFFSWGLYIWFRRLGYFPIVAVSGSLIASFSGMIMTHLTHITLLQSFSLLPVIMWATDLIVEKQSFTRISLWSFLLSQQLFAGFPQAVFITLLFSLSYAAVLFFLKKNLLRFVLVFSGGLMIFFCVSAIQLLPSYEFLKYISDAKGFTLENATFYSFPYRHFLTFINPYILGNPKFGTYPRLEDANGSIFWENSGYIGVLPWLFFTLALFSRNKNRRTKYFIVVLLAAGLLMLGKFSPLYIIFGIWPFNLFRVPSRFIWVFTLSVLIVSLSYVQKQIKTAKGWLRKMMYLLLLVTIGEVLFAWSNYQAYMPAVAWLAKPNTLELIKASSTVLSLGVERTHNLFFYDNGWQDLTPYMELKNSLYPNSNNFWNIRNYDVSAGRVIKRSAYLDVLLKNNILFSQSEAKFNPIAEKLLVLFGVDTVISTFPLTHSEKYLVKQSEVTQMYTRFFIYQIPNTLPFAYSPTRLHRADTVEQAERILFDDAFVLGESVILEEDLGQITPSQIQSFTILERADGWLKVHAVAQNTALLVLTDTTYPGWEAKIDGVPTKIYPANIRQRAVVVPAGNHEVVFEYKPKSFYYGAIISGVSLTGVLIASVYLQIRKVRNRQSSKSWKYGSLIR